MAELLIHKGAYGRTVSRSKELNRIAALPRYDISALAVKAEEHIKELIRPRGTMQLRPLQLQALTAAWHTGGLAGMLSVGSGKTLVASLIPSLFPDCKALILAKAGLVSQGERMMKEYSEHFNVSSSVIWMSYDFLSRVNGTDILSQLQPDIIIADEAQCLARPTAARTKRFLRYMHENPNTMFFFLSGTVTRHSLKDFAHLMALAFDASSPVPRDWNSITEWAECLDSNQGVRYPGALCYLDDLQSPLPNIEAARTTVQKRIKDTLGVVTSSTGSVDSSIEIHKRELKVTDKVTAALKNLEATWCRPDGEELVQAIDVWRLKTQLQLGGFYRWRESPPRQWLEARREWHKALRDFLSKNAKEHCDSPALVISAIKAARQDLLGKHLERLSATFAAWRAKAHMFPAPEVTWEWTDKEHLERLANDLTKLNPAIIWSSYRAPSIELARLMGVPYYGAAEGDSINAADGKHSIVASIKAHKEGRNLQAFSRSVLVSGVQSGAEFEQLLGRTHRAGQEADTVELHFMEYLLPEMTQCKENAKYLLQITGQEQKILIADKVGWE